MHIFTGTAYSLYRVVNTELKTKINILLRKSKPARYESIGFLFSDIKTAHTKHLGLLAETVVDLKTISVPGFCLCISLSKLKTPDELAGTS